MEAAGGICPNCSTRAAVGAPCGEKGCARWDYRAIPLDYSPPRDGKRPDPRVGRLVGKFLVVKELGRGGFGTVYLGLQLPLLMQAAVKLMHSQEDAGLAEVLLRKFEGEAQALARLNHPNTVRLYDFGTHEGAPYMAMEYVANARTLKQEVAGRALKGEEFGLDEVESILRQALDGLEAAHALGIVHRDIKPENLMLQAVAGNPLLVRILDFGLAKFTADGSQSSRVMGTPAYMAPEQLTQRSIGPWTDLYALGVIAFELLTGRRPYAGRTAQEIIARKLDPAYDPASALGGLEVPGEVLAFLRTALARDPERRYRSTAAFRQGLEGALAAVGREDRSAQLSGDLTGLLEPSDLQRASAEKRRLEQEAERLAEEKHKLDEERRRLAEEREQMAAARRAPVLEPTRPLVRDPQPAEPREAVEDDGVDEHLERRRGLGPVAWRVLAVVAFLVLAAMVFLVARKVADRAGGPARAKPEVAQGVAGEADAAGGAVIEATRGREAADTGGVAGNGGSDATVTKPPPLKVQVTTEPAGGQVRLNGMQACTAPCEVAFEGDGPFEVEITKKAFKSVTRHLEGRQAVEGLGGKLDVQLEFDL
jgi:serine/threonine protein kinase